MNRLEKSRGRPMRGVAALGNADDPFGKLFMEGVGTGARRLGLEIEPVAVRPGEPLEPAFETLAGRKVDAVITMSTIFRKEVVALAAKHHMPLLSTARLVPVSGGIRRSAPMVQPACLSSCRNTPMRSWLFASSAGAVRAPAPAAPMASPPRQSRDELPPPHSPARTSRWGQNTAYLVRRRSDSNGRNPPALQ